MAVSIKKTIRVFKHGATEYPDPAPTSKPERCLELLAVANPMLNNAALDGPTYEGGKAIYEVKVQAGTKG